MTSEDRRLRDVLGRLLGRPIPSHEPWPIAELVDLAAAIESDGTTLLGDDLPPAGVALKPAGPVAVSSGYPRQPGPSWLDPNGPPVAACDQCRRLTWDPTELGEVCNIPQPTGPRCTGRFVAVSATPPVGDLDR